jgi:competence protein ComEC
MLLNDRGDVQRSQKQLFARTGVAHLLAISGLHIDMIGLALERLLRLLRLSKRQRRIPCIAILGLYTWIIGAPPSAIRAFLMLSYLWSACFFSRKASMLSAISFAGICSLLLHPYQLWDLGMQFSYVAVLCIALISQPLATSMARHEHTQSSSSTAVHSLWHTRLLRFIFTYSIQSLCISAPISLLTLSLSIEYFGSFSLSGIIINLIAIPLALGIITGGFTTLIIGSFLSSNCASWILTHLLFPYIHSFEQILHWCDKHLSCFWTYSKRLPGIGMTVFLFTLFLCLIFHRCHRKHFCQTQTYQIAMED